MTFQQKKMEKKVLIFVFAIDLSHHGEGKHRVQLEESACAGAPLTDVFFLCLVLCKHKQVFCLHVNAHEANIL